MPIDIAVPEIAEIITLAVCLLCTAVLLALSVAHKNRSENHK